MGQRAFESKPSHIQNAITESNTEHLSTSGRKGAEVVNFKRAERKRREEDMQEMLNLLAEEAKITEELARQEITNENIVPID